MKKIMNWIENSIIASLGILLILWGLRLLDLQISIDEVIHFSGEISYASPLLVYSVGVTAAGFGVILVYFAYREWKKD